MSDRTRLAASASQTIGPFFHVMPGCDAGLECLAAPDTPGERITLRICVLDGQGAPLTDALIELQQTSGHEPSASGGRPVVGFGRRATDESGWATFDSIRPAPVSDGAGGAQAPHVTVLLFARGLLRHLHTRLYFEGDAALGADPLLRFVPVERRSTLLARRSSDGVWDFVIRLQGADETVFFDV